MIGEPLELCLADGRTARRRHRLVLVVVALLAGSAALVVDASPVRAATTSAERAQRVKSMTQVRFGAAAVKSRFNRYRRGGRP